MTESAGPFSGVHSLDCFTLGAPDLDEAERFYSCFGLTVERSGNRLNLRASASDHVWGVVVPADRKKLLSVRFGIFQADADSFTDRVAPVRVAAPDGSNSIWVRTPDGLDLELAVAAKTSPNEKSSFHLPGRHSETRGAGPRSTVDKVSPRRLAHLALFTASVPDALAFYQTYLGLRLSDRSGNDVAFMHGAHGSEHHLIALAKSDGPGLHHCSWDVGSFAEIGQGAMQMQAGGYADGWGVGRHVLGSNYFYYARDPWGSYAEYSADMDYIAANTGWTGSDSPAEDSFYQWGPTPPEDFGENYETA